MFFDALQNHYKNKTCGRALLIDPDSGTEGILPKLVQSAAPLADYIFVGGSLLTTDTFSHTIKSLKADCDIPLVIFPGHLNQIDKNADAFLLLSLVSGRNPELLIGEHVKAAPILKNSGLEIWSTAYLLIDGGKPTTASYMSNTPPIPADKPAIAASTAMAAEMLGFKVIYLDAGSGAHEPVRHETIRAVRENVNLPIIVGGGINTRQKAEAAANAGANMIVIGNAVEQNPELFDEFFQERKLSGAKF